MSLAQMPAIMSRTRRAHRKAVVPKPDPAEQKRLKEEADRLSSSFEEFVKAAWPLIEPGAPLIWEWHMEVLCRVLQWAALFRRKDIIVELVVNLPPGSSKSNIICILYQPWVWTWWSESRWITATHEANLALKQSRKSRDLVTSDWYQARWPLKLAQGAKQQKSWENVKGGTREALGRGGTATGHHAHFIVPDDVLKEQEARLGTPSVVARRMNEAEGFVFGTLGSRAVGKGATRILTGQRLHIKDPSARAIKEGWYHVKIPVHYNPDKASPLDQRTERGEILCPQLRGMEYWDKDAIRLGPTATRAQHEQDPSASDDMLIIREYFKERYIELPRELQETIRTKRPGPGQSWIMSWDLKLRRGVTKSWVAGQVWVGFQSRFYIVDQIRGHLSFLQSLMAIIDLSKAYPWITVNLVEHAANADACEDVLSGGMMEMIRMLGIELSYNEKAILRGLKGITLEPVHGGTFARTQACEGIWATGRVVTPLNAPWMGGATGFLEEHVNFDESAETTDQVSASSQALFHLGVKGDKGQKFRESMAALRQSPLFRKMAAGF